MLGANIDRLILVLAGGATVVALDFGVYDPVGFIVWIGLGLALALPAALPWFLLHTLVLRSIASLSSVYARRFVSVAAGGGCVITIPILLGAAALVDNSVDNRASVFALALGLVYGAVAKLPEAKDEVIIARGFTRV